MFLKNGNKVRCKIIKLEYGILYIDSDGFGKINIKWVDVEKVVTKSPQRILFKNGSVLLVRLDTLENGTPVISYADFHEPVNYAEIGTMTSIGSSFIQRVNGTFSLGSNYVFSNNITTFTSSLVADYINERSRLGLNLNSYNTFQKTKDTSIATSKQTYSLLYNYYFNRRNYWNAILTAEQNSKLGIKYRGFIGNGLGRTVFINNIHSLNTTIGFGYNGEESSDLNTRNSGEGVISAEYRIYKMNVPKVALTFTNTFYGSFTIQDRYRLNSDIKIDFELIKNFTIGISGYYILDTKPFLAATNNYDMGYSINVGVTF